MKKTIQSIELQVQERNIDIIKQLRDRIIGELLDPEEKAALAIVQIDKELEKKQREMNEQILKNNEEINT